MMEGKKVVRTEGGEGKIMVVEKTDRSDEAVSMRLEWDEEIMGGMIEVEEETEGIGETQDKDSVRSMASGVSKGGGGIFEFMENVEIETRDSVLDDKVDEGRKRKREEEGKVSGKKGLSGLPGWERRSKSAREDERWKRTVPRPLLTPPRPLLLSGRSRALPHPTSPASTARSVLCTVHLCTSILSCPQRGCLSDLNAVYHT